MSYNNKKQMSSGELAIIGVVLFIMAGSMAAAGIGLSFLAGLAATGFWIAALVKWLNKGE